MPLTQRYRKILSLINPGLKKYFLNTFWLFGERVLRIISGIFVGVWVAKFLGPQQFGILSYALAFTAIFGGIAKLGLDDILIRELITQPKNSNSLLGTSFWLKLIGAFVTIFIIFLTLAFTDNENSIKGFIILIASSLFFQSFEVVEFYFRSQVRAKVISICKVIQLILSTILKIYFVIIKAELIWFVLLTTLDAITLALSYVITYRVERTKIRFFRTFNFQIAKRLLKDSWPFIFTSLVVSIYMKIDQVMIMEMLDAKSVSYYSIAVTLSTAWYFIPTIIASSVFPAIINSRKINTILFYSRLQDLFTIVIWIALIAAILVQFSSHFIIDALYGEEFEPASNVLKIHIWGGLAVSYGIIWTNWIIAENLQRFMVVFHVTSMVLNILINYYLIPIFGIQGAAIATALASISAQTLGIIFYKRELALKFLLNSIFPIYTFKKYF